MAVLVMLATCFSAAPVGGDENTGREFFESKIRPVLVRHCYKCHSSAVAVPKGSLLLDSRDAVRRGGESGPAVVPAKPDESLIVAALRHDSLKMPPEEKLPDAVIADFVAWIEMGAPDPRDGPPNPQLVSAELWESEFQQRRGWWSLQPPANPAVPIVQNSGWSDRPIDRFVLARLEHQGLTPAPPADRTTLVRRLTFALTGLPPTPDEVAAFEQDESPLAWERLVDRLLDSPHFGERWARHWMDVVRYTDTYGYEWDIPAKGAWRYRDYLIRAFNSDVPFDQLVREQIAGDLLEHPRINATERINESLIGVMFYQMGEKRHGDSSEFNGIHQEMLDNKIDAFSKTFQALTVSCSRCHDHKLDAVSQRDYYALAGLFMSSRWITNTADMPDGHSDAMRQLNELKQELRLAFAAASLAELRRGLDHGFVQALKTEPPLEDAFRPLFELRGVARNGGNVPAKWQELAQRYALERDQRTKQNAASFVEVADFRKDVPAGWSVDGVGLRDRAACGDFSVSDQGDRAIHRLWTGGLVTNSLSPRLNGALRTPHLNTFDRAFLSFECSGGEFAAHRTVIDNAFLTEKQTYLDRNAPGWTTISTNPAMKDRHIYVEFATKTSNPNFPPRVGLGGPCTEEQAADPRSWFAVTRVFAHDTPAAPADELTRFTTLFAGAPPQSLEQVRTRYADWFASAIRNWQAGRATEDDVRLINGLLDNGLLTNRRDVDGHPEVARLVTRYREVEATLKEPCTVNGLADVDPGFDYRLNVRGDYDQLGDSVPRGYLRVITGSEAGFTAQRSGRRELAEFVASAENPLTARVYVNRVWHWLFGTGIVATPSDFGHLGDRPSHPELLDWLTRRFIEEGWSLQKLIRSIVLSETWRQSGQSDERAVAADPHNRLLHHYPLRRLEAEAIRDAMLAVSGRLDRDLYGRPIDPQRANEDSQKRLFSGPMDGNGRRSLYTKVTIMEPPRFLALFNQPKPKLPTGKRDVSNTPAQSLALLNDPFVLGQAQHWAEQLVLRPDPAPELRLQHMFRIALGRNPTLEDTQRWNKAVSELASLRQTESGDLMQNVAVWNAVAHAMFNTKEFIYLR